MEKAPGFGAMLARLLSHKGLSAGRLARRIGIPESDLQAVLDGAAPDGSLSPECVDVYLSCPRRCRQADGPLVRFLKSAPRRQDRPDLLTPPPLPIIGQARCLECISCG